MEKFYSEKKVFRILEKAEEIRDISWKLPPNHPLLLSLYDVELAIPSVAERREDRYGVFDEKKLAEFWIKGKTVNQIAIEMKTSELKIYREKWRLARKISDKLNGLL